MDPMSFTWLFWLAGFFLSYELAAVVFHWRTLSEQTWNWFSLGQTKVHWQIRRAVFLVFWVCLGVGHFYFQAPALWSVILPGIPFALVVAFSTFVWKDATEGAAAMGEPVQFSWWKSLGKGVQSVLELLASVAIVAAVDAVLGSVDEAPELMKIGVPAASIPVVLLVVRMVTNWWKVKRGELGRQP